MGLYNVLEVETRCPHCATRGMIEAEFRFGWMDLNRYRLGDRVRWDGGGVREPRGRPPGGDFSGEAYAECPTCHRDFWLRLIVRDDRIVSAEVDYGRSGYVPLANLTEGAPPAPEGFAGPVRGGS